MNKIKAFFYGIISASGAALFQQIILVVLSVEIIDTSKLTPLLIFGAFSEEIFKFIFIYKIASGEESSKEIVLSSLLVGVGFSLIELTFKFWGNLQNIRMDYLDYLGIVAIHALTAGIIGYFLSFKKSSLIPSILGISLAFILHLTYNAFKIYIF